MEGEATGPDTLIASSVLIKHDNEFKAPDANNPPSVVLERPRGRACAPG